MRITQPSQSRLSRTAPVILFAAIALLGCTDSTAPGNTAFDDPTGTFKTSIVAVLGVGEGGVSVTPKSIPEGYFAGDFKFRIRKAKPNTTYTVQRAAEAGRAGSSNGICERGLSISPWSGTDTSAAPAFLTFIPTGSTTAATLTTSATGDGTLDFEFRVSLLPKDTKFDVRFRLVDDQVAPGSVLLSQCVTISVI